jgi:hypothetical protein
MSYRAPVTEEARMRNAMRTAIVTGVLLVVASGQAHAATTLGQTFDPDDCGSDTTYIQTADPGNRYVVPFNGVITRWSYQADASAPATDIQLKLGTVAPGTDLTQDANVTIVAQSAVETPVAGMVNTYATRIPVQAGYRLGEWIDGGNSGCSREDPSYFDHYFSGGSVPPGTTDLFTSEDYQQNISAVLEADADGDGFGDETQDQCATEATTQGPCVPPETTITKGPDDQTEKPKAKFKFESSDANSSFTCRLKGKHAKAAQKEYAPCESPKKYKNLDPGKYKFFVFATDPGGVADSSPAKQQFRVLE